MQLKPIALRTPPSYCEYAAGPCDQSFDSVSAVTGIFLFPSKPDHIAAVIEAAAYTLRKRDPTKVWHTWRDLPSSGQLVFCTICKTMRHTDVIIVDVTTLNFNLLFEFGFALGLEQPVLPVRDTSIITNKDDFRQLGLLDTIGYVDFQNSDSLVRAIQERLPIERIPAPGVEINLEAPLYLIKGPLQTEGDVKLLSALKKSAVHFRSLDVVETPRLSLNEARRQVDASLAVVAHLIDPQRAGATIHNARCALIAGMAMASGKTVLLLQEGEIDQPIDYRDVVVPYRLPDHVPRLLDPFLRKVISRLQERIPRPTRVPERFLERLNLGDVAAENEIQGLRSYFVRTSQYSDAKRGLARLVTGRKGSGKTAIFYAVRDSIPRSPAHLVLDLKPEGHQFTKLREIVLAALTPGLQEHTLAAFWNYILLCELAQKIRDYDYTWAQRDPDRRQRFERVLEVYSRQVSADAGDFSERLLRQVDSITERFGASGRGQGLTGGELTQILFHGEIKELDDALAPYLEEKAAVWVLVDNLDKFWPTRGASSSDILILRSLLEATRKLQRQLEGRNVEFHSLVFLRNDIFDHLLRETPDRGKDTAITLDWNDPEVFKEIVVQRVRASSEHDGTFTDLWPLLITQHVGAQDSFIWMVERTLMRPRDLLNFLHRAVGVAINRGHEVVTEDDLLKAEESYSEDLLLGTAWELQDVNPDAIDILYRFDRQPARLSYAEVASLMRDGAGIDIDAVIELLVWFGFLGVTEHGEEDPRYSYQVRYNVEKLLTPIRRGTAEFTVHPAYRRALSSS
jgi:hypothetical protein